jgi:hypothetical protein
MLATLMANLDVTPPETLSNAVARTRHLIAKFIAACPPAPTPAGHYSALIDEIQIRLDSPMDDVELRDALTELCANERAALSAPPAGPSAATRAEIAVVERIATGIERDHGTECDPDEGGNMTCSCLTDARFLRALLTPPVADAMPQVTGEDVEQVRGDVRAFREQENFVAVRMYTRILALCEYALAHPSPSTEGGT